MSGPSPDSLLPVYAQRRHCFDRRARWKTDGLLAGCLLSLSDGITANAVRDNNQHGNIVDGLIAGLKRYREEMVACGKIT